MTCRAVKKLLRLKDISTGRLSEQIQIWKLDTADPDIDNISYMTTLEDMRLCSPCLRLCLHMNSNFLLIRIPSKSEIKLRAYRFDLTGFSTKVLGGADPTNQDQSKLEITLELVVKNNQ